MPLKMKKMRKRKRKRKREEEEERGGEGFNGTINDRSRIHSTSFRTYK